MKRNSLFGAAAIFVAGAAIGGGAIVSQQAMATDTPEAATDSVTIGMVSSDGDAVQCTFTGADAADLMPIEIPAPEGGTPAIDGQTGMGSISGAAVAGDGALPEFDGTAGKPVEIAVPAGSESVSGVAVSGDGALPEFDATSGEGSEVVAVESGAVVAGHGALPEFDMSSGEPAEIIEMQTREGTSEECAALRSEFLTHTMGEPVLVEAGANAAFLQGSTGVEPNAGGSVAP